jgi:serine/threonine protein kinase
MGPRLGRYVVLKHLASGGMADVLLGRSDGIEGFERHVVLKRIRPEFARDQRFIRMFLDEARVAANLHHQHIVQVHDIGESSGEYFIAMEYIHGEDVRTILSTASKTRAHVPLGHAIAIVSAAAAGLHYAHERRGNDKRPLGIVHRDVSPSNVLVGYDGSIKVVDFGIAKASMRQETRSGSLKGKVSYMSPEQCKGAEVDRRSDVYALGVVLYELATTTRLFKGDNDYLVMDQIVNGRVSLPRVRRPDLPNELSAIIMRAIAPDAERRYFTADELRIALDQFAAKAGLTASTSAIASYMRKQFGERPEPWTELGGQFGGSLDDLNMAGGEAMPNNSWTELPRSDDNMRRSSGSIPRHTGPISVVSVHQPPADSGEQDALPPRVAVARLPSTPPPATDSKMGWESQKPAASPMRFTPAKLAMICVPLVLLLGIAIWKLAASSGGGQVASAAKPIAAPAAPAPMVTPIAEQHAAASDPATEAYAAMAHIPEPLPPGAVARPRSSQSSGSKKAGTGVVVKIEQPSAAPLPGAKPETAAAPAAAVAAPVPAPAAPAPAPAPPAAAAVAAPVLPPPVPAPPAAPQNVAPTALDANRVSGERDILPDDITKAEIGRSGKERLVATYKLCINPEGAISTVSQLVSTGFPAYDTKILDTIRTKWRYRPFMVNGKAAAVCTAVRFIYSQK